jgi:lipopolysaccharide export LptBFGC system permease protein LptF
MVFTLQRYIFRELFRVFLLATVGLTLMLTLGMILQPIQKYGVGPQQVIVLLGYLIPVSMTFVLPMSALFAATLVYGRFAADNELDACRASGISMNLLIYPGLVLAILVSGTTLVLSFWVVPNYVKRAERAIKADAKQILFRNIERRGYYDLTEGGYKLYADAAFPNENELVGAVVIATDRRSRTVESIISADRVKVEFVPSAEEDLTVTITAINAFRLDAGGATTNAQLTVSSPVPELLPDDIKFKTIDQIKKIRSNPLRFRPIARLARQVHDNLAMELLKADIARTTSGAGGRYYQLYSNDRLIRFTADTFNTTHGDSIELLGNVIVEERDAAAASKPLLYLWKTEKATIQLEVAGKVMLVMYNALWRRSDGATSVAMRPAFHGLDIPEAIRPPDTGNTITDIASGANILANPSKQFKKQVEKLNSLVSETFTSIMIEMQVRLSFSLGCILLILIGIALGIRLKGGHLLTAFGVSSIPAAVLVVCIIMGKNLAYNRSDDISGIGVMWGGMAVLAVLTMILYRRLLRT